jgi:hypothetical protein
MSAHIASSRQRLETTSAKCGANNKSMSPSGSRVETVKTKRLRFCCIQDLPDVYVHLGKHLLAHT